MNNSDKIALLRGGDVVSAIRFYEQVCLAAGHHFSTFEVFKILAAQGDCASTITAQELAKSKIAITVRKLAITEPSHMQDEECEHTAAPQSPEPPPSCPTETRSVVAEPKIADSQDYTRDETGPKSTAALSQEHDLEREEADELHNLLEEMRPFDFKESRQVSNYIRKYKLGYKYPNISGILKMVRNGEEWDFHGGFSPRIYAIICRELGLSSQRSEAIPVGFIPFKIIPGNQDTY